MQWFVPIICLCGKVSPASGLVFFFELGRSMHMSLSACVFAIAFNTSCFLVFVCVLVSVVYCLV